MDELTYRVRVIMNNREGCRPSMFTSKDDAVTFANEVARMDSDRVKVEIHVYEVKEITY